MSNKQRQAWRPWAFWLVLLTPFIIACVSWITLTDGDMMAFIWELDQVAVGLWFILLAAAWLRARKQESKALQHAIAVRARTDLHPSTIALVDTAVLRAQGDLAMVNVMWQALFILFGLLRLVLHFSAT